MFEYVLISFCFKSLFNADSAIDARAIALQIASEKNLCAFLVYNRRGDLIMSYPEH